MVVRTIIELSTMTEDINVQTVNVMSPRVQLLKNYLSAKDGGRDHGMNLMGILVFSQSGKPW